MDETKRVHLSGAWATLLSTERGSLVDCANPSDPTCKGGVASVAAYNRYFSGDEPSLVLMRADTVSPFVQMHKLGWSLNRLVLRERMGWKMFLSSPSLLLQNSRDFNASQRDLSDLQTRDMPLVLTNAAVPPSNSWSPFTESVHFDEETGLAILSIVGSDSPFSQSQVDTTKGALDYVHRVNELNGCFDSSSSVYEEFVREGTEPSPTESQDNGTLQIETPTCYVSIIYYADTKENFQIFQQEILSYENKPNGIVEVLGIAPEFYGGGEKNGVLVNSLAVDEETYYHLTIDKKGTTVSNFTFFTENLFQLPNELKDDKFDSDIKFLRNLAVQAFFNDPIVGSSETVPVHRKGTYRRCASGECELGNLFTDALQWWTNADIAFVSSGGLRGLGWQAGNVKVSDLWNALPFPNTDCTGLMTGVSLFKLFNYSTSIAAFEGADTSSGGRLLQVSGARITYNTNLQGSRLVKIEMWDKRQNKFVPIDRLKLYKFATDSFLCGAYEPFPALLGKSLLFEGEMQGVIGGDLHQNIVGEFLSQLGGVYGASIEGRLINDTSISQPLNLIQTKDSCEAGFFWRPETYSCEKCSLQSNVGFLSEQLEFTGDSGSKEVSTGTVSLVNSELVRVAVVQKTMPPWAKFNRVLRNDLEVEGSFQHDSPTFLESGEKISLELMAEPKDLEAGTARATVVFGVLDGGNLPGCTGQDVSFDLLMRVNPSHNYNHLGSIRFVGFGLSVFVAGTAIFFAAWVLKNRQLRIVKTMQPLFLVAICTGILIMGAAIIPLSVDDGWASEETADFACMAMPWFFSIGFTVTMGALFSKLWRINKLFNSPQLRRMRVVEKDVIGPFVVLFALNFVIMLVYTIVDPSTWTRQPIDGEEWNTYGSCSSSAMGNILFSIVAVINLGALFLAFYQAFKTRNISDEFSESKKLGVALFSWVQLLLIGLPVFYLIDEGNPTARYFVLAGILFTVCMSMLLLIFVPLILQCGQAGKASPRATRQISTNTSGYNPEGADGARQTKGNYSGVVHITGVNLDVATAQYLTHTPSESMIPGRTSPIPVNEDSASELSSVSDHGDYRGFGVDSILDQTSFPEQP